ncbi:hypothetical protein EUZ85_30745 [Hahella sp. KA22]|uniref:hypothetical protein n=1 Tax=Hahella sp. KA22 TaxID=1628392 RepID=UPI000FDD9671|nr:hypothetical protein [Hahella sp. KA22]AZZ94859.1 hypothetical protein ENC22_28160 [Hahella sp. KA22]QAY58232.1 hypothetical protein EUZ85_30745 [Hahella sp. KA22]
MPAPLSLIQMDALIAMQLKNGEHWKEALLKVWDEHGDDHNPVLRHLRDTLGVKGLQQIHF